MRFLIPSRKPAALLGACLLVLALRGPLAAQETPRPPCEGMAPFPAYAAADAPPQVGVWSSEPLEDPGLAHVHSWSGEAVGTWPPPPCTDWTALPFTVALAVRFRDKGGMESLLRRVGAVSKLAEAPYWAAARRRWEPLFDAAYAVGGPEAPERRDDFRPEEMQAGRDLYSHQDPGGPVGGAVYRMRLREVTPDRLVVEVENVTTARMAALFPLGPGTLRFVHFFTRTDEAEDLWGYYGLMGIAITPDSARTYVNRMAGIFRHLAGIPGEQTPPVWP